MSKQGEVAKRFEDVEIKPGDELKGAKPIAAPARDSSCLINAKEGEPVFVLRAQDALAPVVISFWIDLVVQSGSGAAAGKLAAARQLVQQMRDWQARNGCKVPD